MVLYVSRVSNYSGGSLNFKVPFLTKEAKSASGSSDRFNVMLNLRTLETCSSPEKRQRSTSMKTLSSILVLFFITI